MSNPAQILLGRYHYTALDKLAACTQGAQPSTQRFYLKERLSTEIQGTVRHSVMQHEEQLLAQQQQQAGTLHTQLLATDQQRSVLALLDATRPQQLAYSPYGHHVPENGLLSLLGFSGERPDPLTGWYLLGNGYRAFDPVLMRFICPDGWSPFGRGGLNTYAYCLGDPVNFSDPTGHFNFGKAVANLFGVRSRTMHGQITKLTSFDEGFTFITTNKSVNTLNIVPGPASNAEGIATLLNNKNPRVWGTPTTKTTIAEEVGNLQYERIRLIKSGSAKGGKNSLAQQLSNLTQKPVTGFRGKAEISQTASEVKRHWGQITTNERTLSAFRNLPEFQNYAIKNFQPQTFNPKKAANTLRSS